MRTSVLVLLLSTAYVAQASLFSGFTVGRQFEYLGKFCFTWTPSLEQLAGHISGEIQTDVSDLQLAIYDDETMFWNYVMTDPECDCACKTSAKHTKYVYNVTATTDLSIPFTFSFDIHEHLRPRFWYVALARCVPGGDEYVPPFAQITEASFKKYYFTSWYEIHMTQGDGSELPVQQQGLTTIYGVFSLFSGAVALMQTIAARRSRLSESFHPIMKLLTLIVFFFCMANALLFLHFYLFEYNGVGLPLFKYLAKIVLVFVRVGTILLAMLVAKGWTINSVKLEGQEKLSCVMVSILGLYLSMAMWYFIWLDPASTLYIYDSWPGIGICALLLSVFSWFLNTILETRSYEEAAGKRRFFLQVRTFHAPASACLLVYVSLIMRFLVVFAQIACLFSIYIISLPVIVLIASFLSPWVREKIVTALTTSVDYCVYVSLIYLLWPSRAPRYFERLYSVSSASEKATLRDQHLPTEEL